jgi:hypothetical protein
MSENEIVFWDRADTEYLSIEDKDEAIEKIIDDLSLLVPSEIEVVGYKRVKIKVDIESSAENLLSNLIENLDEDYGGEDGTDITEEMSEYAIEFVKKILSIYPVWSCEEGCRETIDAKAWVEQHRKDWIENGMKFETNDQGVEDEQKSESEK